MLLTIKLRDGFKNDTVAIRANGKEVYRQSGVNTDLSISYADAAEITVDDSAVKLEVEASGDSGANRKTIELKPAETPFVEVWILDGKMELRPSKTEMPML